MKDTEMEKEASPFGAAPLDGIRVLDIGHIVAGPMVGGILADFGADVIKVENPRHPDDLRSLLRDEHGVGLWSKVEDRNKRPITLDLKTPKGVEIFKRLVERSDVLVDNFRPDTLAKLGLSDETLQELNSRLIICHITGWGMTGPYRMRGSYGRIAEAISGFANLNGERDGSPMHSAMSLGDTVASVWAAYGILLALLARGRDGEGQIIDVGLHEPLFRQIETQIIAFDQLDLQLTRQGNRNPAVPISNLYRTKDGRWYTVGSVTPKTAQTVIEIVGLAEDAEFSTLEGVNANPDEYHRRVQAWMLERDAEDIDELFAAKSAPGAPVLTPAEMITHPQIVAREMVVTVDDEDLGKVRMPGIVPKLMRTPGVVRWAGRSPGFANREVFSELGLDDEEIRGLTDEGII